MELKTLKVSKKIWTKLNKMKYQYGYKNIDEIIEKLLEIIPALEMEKKK